MFHLYGIASNLETFLKLTDCGVPFVQYRNKSTQNVDISKLPTSHSKIIINDSIEDAIRLDAWGVHLGQQDLFKYTKKELLQRRIKLGISTHTEEELYNSLEYSPDYLAYGPIFKTNTKFLSYPPCGVEQLRKIVRLSTVPVIAIGGLSFEHTSIIRDTGAFGMASISKISSGNSQFIKDWMRECQLETFV